MSLTLRYVLSKLNHEKYVIISDYSIEIMSGKIGDILLENSDILNKTVLFIESSEDTREPTYIGIKLD